MEAEIKLLLPSAVALRALAARAGVPDRRGVRQRNEFFDSPSRALHACDCHLRLRREDDLDAPAHEAVWVVTLKGPKQTGGAVASLALRAEEEATVDEETASAMLRGDASPLDALPPSPLVQSVASAAGGERPVLQPGLGFVNVRIHAPFELQPPSGAPPMAVTLELDTTTFSAGDVVEEQWEVECEVQDLAPRPGYGAGEDEAAAAAAGRSVLEALARDAEAALQALLASLPECGGKPCPAARGKRARHKAFLKAVRKGARRQ